MINGSSQGGVGSKVFLGRGGILKGGNDKWGFLGWGGVLQEAKINRESLRVG